MTDAVKTEAPVKLDLTQEPFEQLQKSLITSSPNNWSILLEPYLPFFATPMSLFANHTSLDRGSLESLISRDSQYLSLRSPDAIHAVVELSKNCPIDVLSLLGLYQKGLDLALDQNVTLNHSTGVFFEAYAIALGLYRRELYCYSLCLDFVLKVQPDWLLNKQPSVLKGVSELIVSILKLLVSADSKDTRPVLTLTLSTLYRALMRAVNFSPTEAVTGTIGTVFSTLISLCPSVGGKTVIASQGVTVGDADFVLDDRGTQSGKWTDQVVLILVGLAKMAKAEEAEFGRIVGMLGKVAGKEQWGVDERAGLVAFWVLGVLGEDGQVFREGLVYGRVLEKLQTRYCDHVVEDVVCEALKNMMESLVFPLNERLVVLKQLDLFAFKHKLLRRPDELQSAAVEVVMAVLRSTTSTAKQRTIVENFAGVLFDRMETVNAVAEDKESYVNTLKFLEVCLKAEEAGGSIHRKILVHHNPMFNFHKILATGNIDAVSVRGLQLRVLTQMVSGATQMSQFTAVTRVLTEVLAGDQWDEALRRTALECLAELVANSDELSRNVMNVIASLSGSLIFQGTPALAALAKLFTQGFQCVASALSASLAVEALADALEPVTVEIFRGACGDFFSSAAATREFRDLQLWTLRWLKCLLELPALDSGSVLPPLGLFAWRSLLMQDSALLALLIDGLLHSHAPEIEVVAASVLDAAISLYSTLKTSPTIEPLLTGTGLRSLEELLMEASAAQGTHPSFRDERLVQALWGSLHKRHLLRLGLRVFDFLVSTETIDSVSLIQKFDALFSLYSGGGGGGLYRVFAVALRDVILGMTETSNLRLLALTCLEKAVKLNFELGGRVLGLVRARASAPVQGFIPDCVSGGSAIEALFLLLDNPPKSLTVSAVADYAAAVRVLAAMLRCGGLSEIAMRYVKYAFPQRYQALHRWMSAPLSSERSEILRGLLLMTASEFAEESDRGTAVAVAEALLLGNFVMEVSDLRESDEWVAFITAGVRLLPRESAVELLERLLATVGDSLRSRGVLALVVTLSNLSEPGEREPGRARRLLERLVGHVDDDLAVAFAIICDVYQLEVADVRECLENFVPLVDHFVRCITKTHDEKVANLLSVWLAAGAEDDVVQDAVARHWSRLIKAGRLSVITAVCRVSAEFAVRAVEAGLVNEAGNVDLLVACLISLPKENPIILEIANATLSMRKAEFSAALLKQSS